MALACWDDTNLFNHTFFPKAFRMDSPMFHRDIDNILMGPEARLCAFACWRGSAKTTKLRAYAAKRIAYGVSRTVMIVSRSLRPQAVSSVEWLQKQVEFNRKFANFFHLQPGKKWRPGSGDIEIIHAGLGHTVRVIAAGITGQVRGINFEDYRPDLIILDDIDDEETTNTPEQREKTGDLVYGAIANSLTPASENPMAQMVYLQTPLDLQDQLAQALESPEWKSAVYGCFDEQGHSRWPARWSTAELNRIKAGHAAQNKLALWSREWECQVLQAETAAFRVEWLNWWESLPEEMAIYIAIDPAISDRDTADFQAAVAVGAAHGNVYLLEYSQARGQDPEELIRNIFRMHNKYRNAGHSVRAIGVEGGSYQKSLGWAFKRAMQRNNYFMTVHEITDRRGKGARIRDSIRDLAFNGRIFVHRDHAEFLEQYTKFRDIGDGGLQHDDLIDAFAMALGMISPYSTGAGVAGAAIDVSTERAYEPLPNWRSSP